MLSKVVEETQYGIHFGNNGKISSQCMSKKSNRRRKTTSNALKGLYDMEYTSRTSKP